MPEKPQGDPAPASGTVDTPAKCYRWNDLLAFGSIGCAVLRALKIDPFSLLAVPPEGAFSIPDESTQAPTVSKEECGTPDQHKEAPTGSKE